MVEGHEDKRAIGLAGSRRIRPHQGSQIRPVHPAHDLPGGEGGRRLGGLVAHALIDDSTYPYNGGRNTRVNQSPLARRIAATVATTIRADFGAPFCCQERCLPHGPSQAIALVDDDRNILTSVTMALEAEGFAVRTYTDGADALRGLTTQPPDLAILDIKMPRMDGMELLGKLRKQSQMPVIFLTSKDDEVDEVLGLRMGADDYITKPFSQRLLIERIRALLRRKELGQTAAANGASDAPVARGDLVLDPARHVCTWKGKEVNLTVTEFLLLKSLAMRPGMVKSRDNLMDAAYGEHVYVDDRTIDSHVKRLRKKFKALDEDFAHIETLYGLGYRYREK